jgi:hypothetical protein
VRRLARRAKDSDQVRHLLAIAAVLDRASRAEAAKVWRGSWTKVRARPSMAWCADGNDIRGVIRPIVEGDEG